MQPNISVDIDGVLANFNHGVKRVAAELGKHVPLTYEPVDWTWSDVFTHDDWNDVWASVFRIPDFWLSLPAYIENVQAVRDYQQRHPDHRTYFVTARMQTGDMPADLQSHIWLRQREITGHVITVDHMEQKRSVMEQHDIQYSVDDYPQNVIDCNAIVDHQAFLLDRRWNRNAGHAVPCVYSIQQFLGWVETGRDEGGLWRN